MDLRQWIDLAVGIFLLGIIIYLQIKGYIVINKGKLETQKERTHQEVELKYKSSINAFKKDVSDLTEKNHNLEKTFQSNGTVRLKARKELNTLIEKSNQTGFISSMGTKQRVRKYYNEEIAKIIDKLL